MQTILLISPYWKESHRWMVSSVKLAELWQRLGHRVVVVCMGPENGIERVSETLTIYRKKDWFFPDPLNFGVALGFTGLVRRVIRRGQPDLIIVNKVLFWTSFCLLPLRLTGHRILLLTDTLVGMTWWPRGMFSKCIMGAGAWTLGWLVLLCARQIVFFHPQPPSLLKRLGILHKSQVIPSGIDPSGYRDQRLGTRDQKPDVTVTYVGRLESVKGVDDFLAAVLPLKSEYPKLTIQVVGWYPSASSGQANHPLVKQYERQVVFTGLRDDIPEILSETDIFVLPSYSEGLSNALMEAMSSGCACIASEVGGNRFLLQNGVSGFLFPPGDRAVLRAHVQRLLDDPTKRRMLGEAARQRIDEHFSWDVVGRQYQQVFREWGLAG
ncbi:MAG: glycosyltransferase family 4 protein [Candidatus Peribacteraceae bacterium]|nr:glycosyltransferase family 4 protein [Candidatus Peribacteraceae bacterium]